MTCSMPAAGYGPGILLVGQRPEDALWFAERGFVACVIGVGDTPSALDRMHENPVVQGRVSVWENGKVWHVGEEDGVTGAADAQEALEFISA